MVDNNAPPSRVSNPRSPTDQMAVPGESSIENSTNEELPNHEESIVDVAATRGGHLLMPEDSRVLITTQGPVDSTAGDADETLGRGNCDRS